MQQKKERNLHIKHLSVLDCSFCVHHKCVQNVLRICAHVITSERNNPLDDISPEIGLAMQYYKCAECSTALNFSKFIFV